MDLVEKVFELSRSSAQEKAALTVAVTDLRAVVSNQGIQTQQVPGIVITLQKHEVLIGIMWGIIRWSLALVCSTGFGFAAYFLQEFIKNLIS